MAEKYELDGYAFSNAEDLKRAKKEKETIAYIAAHTDITDMKAIYKIYKISVEKQSFQTVFGLEYIKDLRDRLIGSGTVTEDLLEPIPIGNVVVKTKVQSPASYGDKQMETDREKWEQMRFRGIIKNFLIVVLTIVIGVMLFVTYNYKYSIFTYFTNYKEKMRDEVNKEYQEWEEKLEEREKELEKREQK